jgi:hypothetical protein
MSFKDYASFAFWKQFNPSLRPKHPVSRIAKARKDITNIAEAFIHRSRCDVDIRMGLLHARDAFRRG